MSAESQSLAGADVEVLDAEIVGPGEKLSKVAATNLDRSIRADVSKISGHVVALTEKLERAKRGRIHEVLGLPSGTAYVADRVQVPFARCPLTPLSSS